MFGIRPAEMISDLLDELRERKRREEKRKRKANILMMIQLLKRTRKVEN